MIFADKRCYVYIPPHGGLADKARIPKVTLECEMVEFEAMQTQIAEYQADIVNAVRVEK